MYFIFGVFGAGLMVRQTRVFGRWACRLTATGTVIKKRLSREPAMDAQMDETRDAGSPLYCVTYHASQK